ncbi:MAG: hypothetical protein M0P12_02500 [Paludibacteraceae bacterium]|nr:hypothetical protein [Paludibacteraceae bacterium]
MIKRIFHPIGQGAFYSEQHDNINIVYDCGNWKNTKQSDEVIKQSFNTNDIIDLLCISHFDYDHISKIPVLKDQVKEIKRVLLPLLHEEEKILLSNIYWALDKNLLPLINDPQHYFGNDTIIIHVKPKPIQNNENTINDNIEPQSIDDIEKNESGTALIESGTPLTIKQLNDWVFIPYNYEYEKRNITLIKELKKNLISTN